MKKLGIMHAQKLHMREIAGASGLHVCKFAGLHVFWM
tara:strand:+ start:144 stop:254 length:111 start_codon:yes stop_codon:yes gene_type:complete